MEAQCTKGPWFNTSEDDSVVGEVMDQPLDSGVTMHITIYGPNAKHDARLISCAPDLVKSLKELLEMFPVKCCAKDRAQEVLNKALGVSNISTSQ